ncbi:MAG: 5'-nucleotidase, partial [Lachnospiraceae bacterium]|nr:5'-nucleotidase [Lachnospiraceae bacterium]
MAYDLENKLVVGVSSRTLFDLTYENKIFEEEGVEAYSRYQVEHEADLLRPGPGFPLVRALLNLNELPGREGCVEVIIMSRNSPDTSLRVFKAIEHYGLRITRAVLAG